MESWLLTYVGNFDPDGSEHLQNSVVIVVVIWRNNGSFIAIIRHGTQGHPEFGPFVHIKDNAEHSGFFGS